MYVKPYLHVLSEFHVNFTLYIASNMNSYIMCGFLCLKSVATCISTIIPPTCILVKFSFHQAQEPSLFREVPGDGKWL